MTNYTESVRLNHVTKIVQECKRLHCIIGRNGHCQGQIVQFLGLQYIDATIGNICTIMYIFSTAADYSHTLTKITVNNGASTGCSVASTITVIDDNLIEGGSGSEYFIVQLQNGTSVLVPYNRSSTNVTILENHG